MEAFAWPAAVVVLVIVFLVMFRKPIAGLLDRTREVSRSGLKAAPTTKQPADDDDGKPSAAEELLQLLDSQLILEWETSIRHDLDQRSLTDASDRERVLVRYLAAATLARAFEHTYYWIWGSQLGALQFLNTLHDHGAALETLRPWHDQAVPQGRIDSARSFEQWLAFLEGRQLIAVADGTATITLAGREFLKYVVQAGYSVYKEF